MGCTVETYGVTEIHLMLKGMVDYAKEAEQIKTKLTKISKTVRDLTTTVDALVASGDPGNVLEEKRGNLKKVCAAALQSYPAIDPL